jgi:hypothetical protein
VLDTLVLANRSNLLGDDFLLLTDHPHLLGDDRLLSGGDLRVEHLR